jgi:hypothetical protein
MNAQLPSLHVSLAAREPLSVREAKGTRVRVLEGMVWITEEGYPDDFFVSAGETFVVQGEGQAVLLADQTARVELVSASPVSVHTEGLWSQVVPRFNRGWQIDRSPRPLALYAQ